MRGRKPGRYFKLKLVPVRGVREGSLLRSTLEARRIELASELLYVADDMVQSGATFAAFRTAIKEHGSHVRVVLLALVFSERRPNFYE
jgi:adenine/guanine phosphoribosyltransferase-like PRPP-binding protein